MAKKKSTPDKVKDVPKAPEDDLNNKSSEEPTEKAEEPEKPEVKKVERPPKREPGYYVAPGKSISVNRKGNLSEGTKVELDIFGDKPKASLNKLIEKGVIEEVS